MISGTGWIFLLNFCSIKKTL